MRKDIRDLIYFMLCKQYPYRQPVSITRTVLQEKEEMVDGVDIESVRIILRENKKEAHRIVQKKLEPIYRHIYERCKLTMDTYKEIVDSVKKKFPDLLKETFITVDREFIDRVNVEMINKEKQK